MPSTRNASWHAAPQPTILKQSLLFAAVLRLGSVPQTAFYKSVHVQVHLDVRRLHQQSTLRGDTSLMNILIYLWKIYQHRGTGGFIRREAKAVRYLFKSTKGWKVTGDVADTVLCRTNFVVQSQVPSWRTQQASDRNFAAYHNPYARDPILMFWMIFSSICVPRGPREPKRISTINLLVDILSVPPPASCPHQT